MLIKLHDELERLDGVRIEKHADGQDASHLGAFAHGTSLTLTVTVPRTLGARAVVLRLAADGEEAHDYPLAFCDCRQACDRYVLTLSTEELCGEAEDGLFYYELLFLRGFDTLFSNSINNVDFTLSAQSESRFRLLIYRSDFVTPAWFHGNVMYHVFVDRFRRGEGPATLRSGAVLDENWESGIPQYAEHNGDALANNVFFGGNLWGVIEKLDYLESLGVGVLYLSPIFESASNHRYDTASYERVDSLLGGDAAFAALVEAAHARGIRIVLDGVFNHTGDDSVYFNRRGNYPTVGAYQSLASPYAEWYRFRRFPDEYEAWWNIEILPRLDHGSDACRRYFTAPGGIIDRWTRAGADGWRLDVADELCDAFLDELRETVHAAKPDGLVIGEVWENAADKMAYGRRRRYFRGRQLDSVMNYPFRNAVLALLTERDATTFYHVLTELYASYPPTVSNSLMNLLGTHDTERILTLLGDEGTGAGRSNAELSVRRLSREQRGRAVTLLQIASILQYTVFGVPSVYYGDEAGLEGYHDPFCRMPFPWGREDATLLAHYRALGRIRAEHEAFRSGDFRFLDVTPTAFVFERRACDASGRTIDRVLVAVNVGTGDYRIPSAAALRDVMSGVHLSPNPSLPPLAARILCEDAD